jgi:DNA-binding YbaB/EbfC family protein
MLAGIARLQQELQAAQSSALAAEAVGTAGGGAVTVRASGDFSFDAVTIDPALVGDADVSVVEDLVLAAIRNATSELLEQRQRAMGGLMSGAIGSLLMAPSPEPDGD